MANHPDNSNITVRERVFALMRHFGATRLYQALGDVSLFTEQKK